MPPLAPTSRPLAAPYTPAAAPGPDRAPGARLHHVPRALSSLVGRVRERAGVLDGLAASRLVTLTGPGGAGKTRLAREVAEAAVAPGAGAAAGDTARDAAGDGVWWVELAPVTRGEDVAHAVAAALDVRPTPGRALDEALADAVGARALLVVLDNCEHVVEHAALLAEGLLRACPRLRLLATSREALAVEGEVAWPVPPLAAPPRPEARAGSAPAGSAPGGAPAVAAADVAGYEAVQLFVERARASLPTFALTDANAAAVAAVCARLDGLPLAIELAAANVAVLGVEQTAARLDDALGVLTRGRRAALPRHRTLRALLDWSYRLLGDDEQTLLRRLSVFRGGVTLDAVQAVCGAGPAADADAGAPADVIAPLGRLVEQSLVEVREERGEVRYRLLETVRQYGAALLRGTPDGARTRARHAGWVAGVVAEAAPRMWGPAMGPEVDRLLHDVDDLRAALAWATGDDGDATLALQIAGGLVWLWYRAARWDEGARWLAAAFAASDRGGRPVADRPTAERLALAEACYPAAGMAWFAGDVAAGLAHTARGLAVWDTLAGRVAPAREARGRAVLHELSGITRLIAGQVPGAVDDVRLALAAARRSGDRWVTALQDMRMGLVLLAAGDLAGSGAHFAAANDAMAAVGERWFRSLTLEGMAERAQAAGQLAEAAARARESAAVLAEEPDRWFVARALDRLAAVGLAAAGDAGDAGGAAHDAAHAASHARAVARLMGAAHGLRARAGAEVISYDRARHAAMLEAARAALPAGAFEAEWAAGEALDLSGAFALAATADVGVAADAPAEARAADAASPSPGVPAGPAPAAAAAGALRLDAFGPVALTRDGAALPAANKAGELLLYLVLHPPRTREQVALALWPDASAAQVRNSFHLAVHALRRLLGRRDWVVCEGQSYRLTRCPAPGVTLDCDVDAVLAAADAARAALRAPAPPDGLTLAALGAALARGARGPLDAGGVAGAWAAEPRAHVHRVWGDGMAALADLLAAAGRPAEAAGVLDVLLAREPLRESAHRRRLQVRADAGERERALADHDAFAERLARETGARPARETRALADALRGG